MNNLKQHKNNIPIECLGISGSVNLIEPNEEELLLTQQLESAIKDLNIFESTQETKQRREALIELQDFCNIWIYKKAIEYMYPANFAKTIKGKIFTFGSYRLGVNFTGADIDTLFLVPKFISREEFFTDFLEFLSTNSLAQEIHSVPKAFVPLLKMKFCGVEIDLLFANVDLLTIPLDFNLSLNSERLLRNMDEKDVRSVNGVRVTDDILNLVYNRQVFKSALRIIRIWAKRRCIYSNSMGFLGGVSWAILVARVCQLWPMATVSTIVLNFFKFYGSKWQWPYPILLREVSECSTLNFPQWDPRVNPYDQTHVMPILTPSYPSQNSTYNVCESHKKFIVDQMKKALQILQKIINKEMAIQDLFKPLFFFSFRHYLVVTYRCDEKQIFRENTSLIESKLRFLVQFVENNVQIESALLYLRSYDDTQLIKDENSDNEANTKRWFIGLQIQKLTKNLHLVDEIDRFLNSVQIELSVSYARRRDLLAVLPKEEADKIRLKFMKRNYGNSKPENGNGNKESSAVSESDKGDIDSLSAINKSDDNLFVGNSFDARYFVSFKHFLVVTYCTVNREQFGKLSNSISSKLEFLVDKIRTNQFIKFASNISYNCDKVETVDGVTQFARHWFIGMHFYKVDRSLNLVEEIHEFKSIMEVEVDVTYSHRGKVVQLFSLEEKDEIKRYIQHNKKVKRSAESTINSNSDTKILKTISKCET